MTKNYLKHQPINNHISDVDNSNSGFLLGIISGFLLIACITILLLFNNRQVQRIITEKININTVKKPSDVKYLIQDNNSLIETQKILNVKADHPNGTVGRLIHISFTKNNTIIEIVVTNASLYTIHLNLHGKGVVLVDDLGNKYDLKLPFENAELEIKSGETLEEKLVFQGGVTSKASNLTLITNNQIGSDQSLSRRPKMEFFIPLK
ncbi:hypothetical protein IQ247_28550 [Plectonema cf. radiosum LEGE 06105]|uniref:Uncharacterized protein n=1 Tax=Plectonema cf. radiosum LEGE 06105 TaxID=945769 RepID=A0A8J7FHV1_9CYAN|nr:hypothetical protein [Plectonema radiosum]MBE9216563.1 hypothetical protein [Plectonema cf. radiosum LEGE 06105]